MSEVVVNETATPTEEILTNQGYEGNLTLGPDDDPLAERFVAHITYEDGTVFKLPANLYTVKSDEGSVNKQGHEKPYYDSLAIRFADRLISLTTVLPYVHKGAVTDVRIYASQNANSYTDEEELDLATPIYADPENYWNGVARLASLRGVHHEVTEYEFELVHFL